MEQIVVSEHPSRPLAPFAYGAAFDVLLSIAYQIHIHVFVSRDLPTFSHTCGAHIHGVVAVNV